MSLQQKSNASKSPSWSFEEKLCASRLWSKFLEQNLPDQIPIERLSEQDRNRWQEFQALWEKFRELYKANQTLWGKWRKLFKADPRWSLEDQTPWENFKRFVEEFVDRETVPWRWISDDPRRGPQSYWVPHPCDTRMGRIVGPVFSREEYFDRMFYEEFIELNNYVDPKYFEQSVDDILFALNEFLWEFGWGFSRMHSFMEPRRRRYRWDSIFGNPRSDETLLDQFVEQRFSDEYATKFFLLRERKQWRKYQKLWNKFRDRKLWERIKEGRYTQVKFSEVNQKSWNEFGRSWKTRQEARNNYQLGVPASSKADRWLYFEFEKLGKEFWWKPPSNTGSTLFDANLRP